MNDKNEVGLPMYEYFCETRDKSSCLRKQYTVEEIFDGFRVSFTQVVYSQVILHLCSNSSRLNSDIHHLMIMYFPCILKVPRNTSSVSQVLGKPSTWVHIIRAY